MLEQIHQGVLFLPALTTLFAILGNIWIAIGALLPGIGGSLTRFGLVEALYVTELIGLLFIYRGYRLNVRVIPSRAGSRAPVGGFNQAMNKTTVATLLALALTFPLALSAQDDSAAASNDTDAEAAEEGAPKPTKSFFATTTVTATGTEIDTFEVANPVNVISAERIEVLAPQNAADILRSEPGVDVDGVGANQSRPVIRGLRGLRVLFLENGLRMNNPRRQTDFGEIPGLVDIDSVATMEVVRGPSSVLYGSDAIGGVLNLVTQSPTLGTPFQGSLSLRHSSAGDSTQGGVTFGGSLGRAAYKLGVTERSNGDYDAASGGFGEISLPDGAPVTDSGVDDSSVWGTLAFQLGESNDLRLRLNRYRADDAGFGFVEPALLGDDSGTRIRILYPFQDFERMTLAYAGSNFPPSWIDSLEAQLYYQNNERGLVNDIDINIGPIFPGAPDSSVLADTENFTDLESIGVRLEAVKAIADRHLVTYGVEAYEDDSFNTDSSVTTTIIRVPFPPFESPDVSTDTVANAPNATNSSFGVFAQAEIAASERWKLTVGARNQTVETRAEATPGWDISGLDFEDDATVGSASVLFRATDSVNLSLAYGTAFRAPNLIERLFNGLTPEGIGFQILNPDLESEDSETIDLAFKLRRPNSLVEVNIFRNDIENGIIQYFLSPAERDTLPADIRQVIDQSGVDFVVQQRNADRLRYEGLELAAWYRVGDLWTLGGNYTYLDGERLDSTNPPTGDTFGDKFNLFARYQSAGRWWAEYRVRHNGDDRANLDPDEPVPAVGSILPSFTVHTATAGATVAKSGRFEHEISIVVDNLTDELYSEFSNASFFRPQPKRRGIVTYRMRF